MMKRILLYIAIQWIVIGLHAQSIERMSINSGGSFHSGAGINISASIGQIAVTTVQSGTIVLTQGFQQPPAPVGTPTRNDLNRYVNYTVFPNPVTAEMTVQLSSPQVVEVTVSLRDLQGRVLFPEKKLTLRNQYEFQMDLRKLAEGVYFLMIQDTHNGEGLNIPIEKLKK